MFHTHARRHAIHRTRRGFAAVMAMLFLALMVTLSLGMYGMSTLNLRTSVNVSDVERSRIAAESGMRWIQHRMLKVRPSTAVGNLTATDAGTLWAALKANLRTELNGLPFPGAGTITEGTTFIAASRMPFDADGTYFSVRVEKLPTYNATDTMAADYRDWVRVTCTGVSGGGTGREVTRAVSMVYKLDKKVRFAVVGKVPIQLGRNTLVEGPVGMATPGKFPPVLALSDFKHLKTSLTNKVNQLQGIIEGNPGNYDNRIHIGEAEGWAAAQAAGFRDRNGDNFIDEFDLFLDEFDANRDGGVSKAEFTNLSTGKLFDENLFAAMDGLGAPLRTGESPRQGLNDNVIDSNDLYAKINGQVRLAVERSAWSSNLAGQGDTISDVMAGPNMFGDSANSQILWGASTAELVDLTPSNFNTTGFKNRTGSSNGTAAKTATLFTNWTLTAADANGGTATERTPFGSTSFQATYQRPVFRNITFRNCRVPKGLNALFDNCTFEGVTFVELEPNITRSNGTTTTNPSDGMTWAQRMLSGSFSTTTTLTSANSRGFRDGNNLRFNGCNFKGPLASDVPTAYTHFANSWEFTGATLFNNQWLDPNSGQTTATIVAPQTNIEMGSFTNPDAAPSTLTGVVVAGNIDIRGTSVVDGSIIVTGDGAGNTTLGWFGPSDSNTDPSAMPEGGYGRLNIRYNPYRALPDGINLPVDLAPNRATYTEVTTNGG
jgi:Tfp pilus assembly protein PilX